MNSTTALTNKHHTAMQEVRLLDRWCRRAVFNRLNRIRHGRVTIMERGEEHHFGVATGDFAVEAVIHVQDTEFYRRIALGGTVGAGDAFGDGLWACEDVADVIRIFARNIGALEKTDSGPARLGTPLKKVYHWLRRNSRNGSRRNIGAHYDLGNEFFSLFLDATMSYSCAFFGVADVSLEQASIAKNDRICRKLGLTAADHLLEIGTGWGELAIHAARNFGCRVTTTTISSCQRELAERRVREAGLQDQITILQADYRDLQGRYDKLVSVEMIEAVGHHYYDRFFGQCSRLLKPEGLMLMQAITIADHRYERAIRNVDFIKRYIFPGSCIPSVARIGRSIATSTDMRIVDLEDITAHYVKTLRQWRENFMRRLDDVRQLGYSERFIRLWEYYLGYCEGGFAERYIGDVHIMFAKPDCRRQVTSAIREEMPASTWKER
ncbi:MAG: class I SAM-dependent methyltransferase [Planctomycetota bacterium]|jgi:cyclopropane-fatty-acyl-phospholipid synthase